MQLKTAGEQSVTATDTSGGETGTQTAITVTAGTATYLQITGSSTMVAGATNAATITARDQYGNVDISYAGTESIVFSGANPSPNPAVDPTASRSSGADIDFGRGTRIDFAAGVGTTNLKLYNAENAHIDVTDGSIGSTGAASYGLDVAVSAGTGTALYWVTQPTSPVAAGDTWDSFQIGITDQYGNQATDVVDISIAPSAGSFASGTTTKTTVAGVATFNDITYTTAATITVTGSSLGLPDTPASNDIVVNPAALDHFTVTGIDDPQGAGTLTSPVVTAYDKYNNVKTDYTGTITFTSSDTQATLPANYTFVAGDDGTYTFMRDLQLVSIGDQSVTVTDTVGGQTGSQTDITVTPGTLDHFTVTGITDPQVAGSLSSPVVTAYDQYNNVKTDYTGTIGFSSTDGQAVLPADYTFVSGDNGTHTFTDDVQLKTTGDQSVTVKDGGTTASQIGITVTPAAANYFTLTGITDPQVAGSLSSPVVTVYDQYDNIKTDYTGTINFTSSDGKAVLPSDYTFVGGDTGTKTFTDGVQLKTTGEQSVTVADGGVTGSQTAITVTPAAISYFTLTGITDPQVAGTLSSPVVTAYDLYDNIKTDYRGTITFSSTDGQAVLPVDYAFGGADNGAHTFTDGVQLKTTGEQSVSVADGGATGSQTAITVTPAALSYFTVTGIPNPVVQGVLSSPRVVVYDLYDNIKTDYVGTVTFTSTDAAAILPSDYTFVAGDNGDYTFVDGIILNTVGINQSVTASDGAASGSQTGITVSAAPEDDKEEIKWDDSHLDYLPPYLGQEIILEVKTSEKTATNTSANPVVSRKWGFDGNKIIKVDKKNAYKKWYTPGRYRMTVTAIEGEYVIYSYNSKGPRRLGSKLVPQGEKAQREIVITEDMGLLEFGDQLVENFEIAEGGVPQRASQETGAQPDSETSLFARARDNWRSFLNRE